MTSIHIHTLAFLHTETVTGKSLPEDCSLPAGDAAVDTELANHSEDSEVKQTESSTNQANHQQPIGFHHYLLSL